MNIISRAINYRFGAEVKVRFEGVKSAEPPIISGNFFTAYSRKT